MNIWITNALAEGIGATSFVPFGVNKDSWGWKQKVGINLAGLSKDKWDLLYSLLEKNPEAPGAKVLLADMNRFQRARGSEDGGRPRNCKQFSELLEQFLFEVPGHRIYGQHNGTDTRVAYYTTRIEYHEAYKREGRFYPAHTDIDLLFEEFGGLRKEDIEFYEQDCRGISIVEALLRKGYLIETPELREGRKVNPLVGPDIPRPSEKLYMCPFNHWRSARWELTPNPSGVGPRAQKGGAS